MKKIKIEDSATLKKTMVRVKDSGDGVKETKKLLGMLLGKKVSDSANKTEFTKEEREKLAKEGLALPDGSFPIRNKQDLRDAIAAIGLGINYQKTKKWIIKRARELDAVDMLPEKWKVKDSDDSDGFSKEEKELFKDIESKISEWCRCLW